MTGPSSTAADPKPKSAPTQSGRTLENDHLRVVIDPTRGGKCLSLRSRRTGTEWLLPPLRPYADAKNTSGFDEWDGGGFDECLPTVAATATAPDHGELWRHSWQELPRNRASAGEIALRTTACSGVILFERRAHLEGACLILRYSVANQGHAPQSLLYSAHPLLRVGQGDRISLPVEVTRVRVEGSATYQSGATIPWPNPSQSDLSLVGPPDGTQADKLFAGPLRTGWCALFRPSLGEGVELTFSADVLPYLGLWICRTAWPETARNKQYTVAFEPASAPHDSIAAAEQDGTAWRLLPGERREWTLTFRLIHHVEQPDREPSATDEAAAREKA
jgi:galactose mutarotase-like enzyme